MRILIPLIAVTFLLSGCSTLKFWEDDEVDELAPAKLVDFKEEVRIDKLWSRGVGGQDELYSSLRPALVDDVIYGANDGGRVVAINTSNGKIIWRKELKNDLSGGVGVGGGLVLVTDIEGRIFALERSSGDLRWKTNIAREVLSAPASNGQEVVIQTLDGFLVGLNASNGGELWRYRIDIPSLTLRSPTSPVITGNTVIAGFANGKLVALNTTTGALLWENRVALPKGRSELERMVDIAGSPILEGDMVYVTSYHGRAAAITRGTGRSIWYQDMSSFQQPGYGMDQLYITQDNDEVKALRANSGQVLWSNVQMTYRQLTAPGYVAGYVAVGDAEGYLHILSANDGRFVGRKRVDRGGLSAPILSDGKAIYVYDKGGDITAFKITAK